MGYSKDFLKGLGWIGAFRLAAKLIVFAKVIVAYRYLSPREVGLFGLCALALGLLEMMTETGINIILIRDTKPLSYYLDTAFFVSVLRGLLISIVLFLFAFLLPTFFRDQALFWLLLLVSTIPFIKGFINPAIAKYQKDLNFQKEATLRIVLTVIDAGLSIWLVRMFHTADMLIYAMIITSLAEVVISYVLIRPWPKFTFDWKIYHEIVTPGKWVNAAGILTFAEQNFDNVIVGRVLGSTQLGFYQTAFNLTRSLIVEVGSAFAQVLLPIYGRIAHDAGRLNKAIKIIILPAALIMLVPSIALNTPIVQEWLLYFLQEKWRPMIPLLPYLSVAAWLTGMDLLINPFFVAKNRIRPLVLLYSLGLLLMIAWMIPMTNRSGIVGSAQAVLIARICLQPFVLWSSIKILREKNGEAVV